jgi:hypothetical protein
MTTVSELELVEVEGPRAGHTHLLGVRHRLPAASRSALRGQIQ